MELKEYVRLALEAVPDRTKVSFDIAVRHTKGKLYVESYGTNKIKFSVIKYGSNQNTI